MASTEWLVENMAKVPMLIIPCYEPYIPRVAGDESFYQAMVADAPSRRLSSSTSGAAPPSKLLYSLMQRINHCPERCSSRALGSCDSQGRHKSSGSVNQTLGQLLFARPALGGHVIGRARV